MQVKRIKKKYFKDKDLFNEFVNLVLLFMRNCSKNVYCSAVNKFSDLISTILLCLVNVNILRDFMKYICFKNNIFSFNE